MTTTDETVTLGSRVGAYLLDYLVGLVIGVLCVVLATTSGLGAVLGLVLVLGYGVGLLWWLGTAGLTPGKRVLGLRVVDASTGGPIGIGRALLRQLVLGVLGPVNLVQLATIPKSPRGQGWHDRAASSVVVRAVAAPAVSAAPERVPGFQPSGPPLPTAPAPGGMVPPPPSVLPPPPTAPVSTPAAGAAGPPTLIAPPPGIGAPPVSFEQLAPEPPAPAPVAPEPITPAQSELPVDLAFEPPSDLPSDLPSATVAAPVVAPVVPVTAPPGSVAEAGSRPRSWTLHTAAGESRRLDGSLMVGRDPDGELVDGAARWAVQDPGLTVSKTHALLGLDGDAPWIEDWHSTNGVLLRRSGVERELAPHQRTPLEAGDQIELGDFVLTLKDIG